MKRFPYLYLLTVLLFCCPPLLEASPPTQETSTSESTDSDVDTPAEINQLAKKAHNKGNIKVLVELNERLTEKDYSKIKQKRIKRTRLIEYQQKALLEDVSIGNAKAMKHYQHLPLMALSVTEDELKNLRKSARVNSISEDHIYFPLSHEVSIGQIGADVGWSLGYTGKGQSVVVIDSGVDKSHPYLRKKVVREACFSSRIEDKPTGIKTVTPLCRNGHTSVIGKNAANVRCKVGDIGCAH